FFQAEDGIRDFHVTGVQTCALPIYVLNAVRVVPRHLFVDEALASRAYEDTALPIGHGQTISQPWVVARMTEAILAAQLKRVLERSEERRVGKAGGLRMEPDDDTEYT